MNYLELIGFIQIVLIATTPVVFAGIGELVTEKSGVLNLGVEGMMLVGAVTAFVTLVITGSYVLAFLFSILAGIFMSGLFAFLGRLHPLGIIFASLIIALTYLGAEDAQLFMQVPAAVGFLFQGLVLFYLLGADFLVKYKLEFKKSK